jgi:hypothetical protein
MTTATNTDAFRDYISNIANMPLLGEILSWEPHGPHQYTTIVDALRESGLNTTELNELKPRNVFRRACSKLEKEGKRIIRKLHEDKQFLKVQFTTEEKNHERLNYNYEAAVTINKETGELTCDDEQVLKKAKDTFNAVIGVRTTNDISSLLRQMLKKQAGGLFPLPGPGGYYFIPEKMLELNKKIEKFIYTIGGRIARIPVPAGTPHGNRSVRDAVASGIEDMIEAHRKVIDNLDKDSRKATFTRRMKKIKEDRFKIECFSEYLTAEKDRLTQSLDDCMKLLEEKMELIMQKDIEESEQQESPVATPTGDTV